ncbi:hypothetical protein FOMA001_g19573 [Fusarium oxysporum f. sp. matthiolae]|nr:hypothetical protein FOMA001_g19573 [Fusarium oxysporum f. sp. matthiolae]
MDGRNKRVQKASEQCRMRKSKCRAPNSLDRLDY